MLRLGRCQRDMVFSGSRDLVAAVYPALVLSQRRSLRKVDGAGDHFLNCSRNFASIQ